jgi:hypothetical protein
LMFPAYSKMTAKLSLPLGSVWPTNESGKNYYL